MKAIIQIDVPEHQIGQEVSIYFKDTMMIKGIVQEPKMGHWIIYNYPGHECVYCSSCKEEYYEDDLYLGGSEFPNYCPNYGARMESEEV